MQQRQQSKSAYHIVSRMGSFNKMIYRYWNIDITKWNEPRKAMTNLRFVG